jgi:hypothetical protein
MYPDFKELLSIFNAQRVKYLVVGGYAVSFHAQPRVTKDIDLLIKADAENSKAVYAALAKFGAPMEGPATGLPEASNRAQSLATSSLSRST